MRCLLVFLLLLPVATLAQEPLPAGPEGVLRIGDDLSRFLQRQQVLGNLPGAHLGAQPLSAHEARKHLDELAERRSQLTPTDRQLLAEFRHEVPGPNVEFVRRHIPFIYENGYSLFSVRKDDYAVHADITGYFSLGRARRTATESGEQWVPYWQNTRGARVAGHLGRHLFFETSLEENQWRTPYNERSQSTAPRLPFVRDFDGGYDYMLARGIVGVNTKYVEIRAGRDWNQWGYGANSVALSNYAPVYDQLQFRTSFWRIHYTNLFSMFVDRSQGGGDHIRPRKYGAYHRLAVDLPGNVQVEVFEMVLHGPDTTAANIRTGFELAYLNPIIFYRAVEGDLGSPDNMLLGGGVAWNALPGWRLYSQIIFDELSFKRFTEDWWGNKWGYIVGTQVSDPGGLPGLDFQIEYARLRPYLYSHRSSLSNAVHQNDVLGHPVGSNAWDVNTRLRWQPIPRFVTAVDVAYTRRGRNPDGLNWGGDPRISYDSRDRDRDMATITLQGVRVDEWLVEARAGYELLPGIVAEGVLRYESWDDAETGKQQYAAPFFSLRWGLPFQSVRY